VRTTGTRHLAALLAALCLAAGLQGGAAQAADRSGDFVTRDGTGLELKGKPFRFAGPNIYWLGLDENVGGTGYPTHFRIRDALATARTMGATVVRSHTLGVSLGNELSIEPELGAFNPEAFRTIDYAIAEARRQGLKLVIPLTDEWGYYHGGYQAFTEWLGLEPGAFYTDERAKAAYKEYVREVVTHVNPHTGLAYRDDPTVMSWELGNELNGMTRAWVDEMGAYVHDLAPRQLLAAGRQRGVDAAALASPEVDIVDVHYYPTSAAEITAHAEQVTDAGKVYIAGEHGSTTTSAAAALTIADDPNVTGVLHWSLFGNADDHGFVPHDDGFTVHYPGDTPAMRDNVVALTSLGRLMGDASGLPPVVTGTPVITAITKRGGLNAVAWRGGSGAYAYRVQRSTEGAAGPWTTPDPARLSGNDAPWLDQDAPGAGNTWYRVAALDRAGATTALSDPVRAGKGEDLRTDTLQTWSGADSHSAGLTRTPDGDDAVVRPAPRTAAEAVWRHTGLTGAEVHARARNAAALPRLATSADGTTWRTAKPAVTRTAEGRYTLRLDAPRATDRLRISWPKSPQPAAVTRVTLRHTTGSPAGSAPGAFTQRPADGATGVPVGTAFTWSEAERAAYYRLTVSTHADLSDPVISASGLAGTSYTPDQLLVPDTTYHYAVTALNAAGATTAEGAPGTFTTTGLPAGGVAVDRFEKYDTDADLTAAYPRNTGGDPVALTLDTEHTDGDGGQSLRAAYELGAAGYAGFTRAFAADQDWRGADSLGLWLRSDGSGRGLTVQFAANGIYWEAHLALDAPEGRAVRIPFTDFEPAPWSPTGPLDLSRVTDLAFYVGGAGGSGTYWLDSIAIHP
jgi:hypothetical protein